MDQHKALNSLLECADLVSMLEELTNISSKNGYSATSISGLRITLRNIREQLLNSHDALAQAIVSRMRPNEGMPAQSMQTQNAHAVQQREAMIVGGRAGEMRTSMSANENGAIPRKDLRSAIEKVLDNS